MALVSHKHLNHSCDHGSTKSLSPLCCADAVLGHWVTVTILGGKGGGAFWTGNPTEELQGSPECVNAPYKRKQEGERKKNSIEKRTLQNAVRGSQPLWDSFLQESSLHDDRGRLPILCQFRNRSFYSSFQTLLPPCLDRNRPWTWVFTKLSLAFTIKKATL